MNQSPGVDVKFHISMRFCVTTYSKRREASRTKYSRSQAVVSEPILRKTGSLALPVLQFESGSPTRCSCWSCCCLYSSMSKHTCLSCENGWVWISSSEIAFSNSYSSLPFGDLDYSSFYVLHCRSIPWQTSLGKISALARSEPSN